MTSTEPAGAEQQPEAQEEPDPRAAADDGLEPPRSEEQQEVQLVRTVRYGRLLIVGAFLGAVIAGVVAMLLPVAPDATYELGQAVGLALVIGAVIGLALGGLLALALGLIAKRSRGAALAVHSDVR